MDQDTLENQTRLAITKHQRLTQNSEEQERTRTNPGSTRDEERDTNINDPTVQAPASERSNSHSDDRGPQSGTLIVGALA